MYDFSSILVLLSIFIQRKRWKASFFPLIPLKKKTTTTWNKEIICFDLKDKRCNLFVFRNWLIKGIIAFIATYEGMCNVSVVFG